MGVVALERISAAHERSLRGALVCLEAGERRGWFIGGVGFFFEDESGIGEREKRV